MTAFNLNFNSIKLTDEQFFQLCQDNRDLRFERNASGELIMMPPTGGETGNRNAGLTAQVWIWNEESKLGKVFDSSTGFKLPNGGDRVNHANPKARLTIYRSWHQRRSLDIIKTTKAKESEDAEIKKQLAEIREQLKAKS